MDGTHRVRGWVRPPHTRPATSPRHCHPSPYPPSGLSPHHIRDLLGPNGDPSGWWTSQQRGTVAAGDSGNWGGSKGEGRRRRHVVAAARVDEEGAVAASRGVARSTQSRRRTEQQGGCGHSVARSSEEGAVAPRVERRGGRPRRHAEHRGGVGIWPLAAAATRKGSREGGGLAAVTL
jgi:hypothetical protein